MLDVVRRSLDVKEGDHLALEREVQVEAYMEAIRSAWKAGIITPDEVGTHENLRKLYGIGLEQHLALEPLIMQGMRVVE